MAGAFRLLPVVMVAAGLLLTVKIGGVYTTIDEGFQAADLTVSVARPAVAQQQNSETAAEEIVQATDPEADRPLDPLLFSRTEIEILQDLRKRRRELDDQEAALRQREGILLAAEGRLDQRLMELRQVKTEIEDLISTYNRQQDQELVQLVSIYEKMKAKDAANIFNALELPVLLNVIQGMKEAKAAPILARMNADKARQVTLELAKREEILNVDDLSAQTTE